MYVGETATAVVAAVVRAEPDGSMLPKNLPRRVRELLQSRTHLGRAGRIPFLPSAGATHALTSSS
jgi:hypothetical protein